MSTTDPQEVEVLREQALDVLHQFAPTDLQANELRALIVVLRPIARCVEVASGPRRLRVVEEASTGMRHLPSVSFHAPAPSSCGIRR